MTIRLLFAAAAVFLAGQQAAVANDWMPPVTSPVVARECGSCHMAFQPGFLPSRSWHRLMGSLSDHFGDDASLPADTARTIRDYLSTNAGDVVNKGRAGRYMQWVAPNGVPLRITENPDFLRKHRFPDATWKDPKIVTKSNCPACHVGADRGLYDD